MRRAGLDYWPWVPLSKHATWEEYLESRRPTHVWLFSKFGTRIYHEVPFGENDAFVFGSETKGLGREFLSHYPAEQILRIPIVCDAVRSLNLSNAVSIVLYEARRQLGLDRTLPPAQEQK